MIAAGDWKPADGLQLEPNALRAAMEVKASQALTAGPGAGKTEMLAQRADFLLRTGTCRYPKRILAISFKTDASRNLKDRVRRRCGAELSVRFDSYTFHAFAKRIIDRFRPILTGEDELNPGYTIVERNVGRSRGGISFDDLVPLAIKILKTSAMARNAVRQTYSDVFLDEFQDCTNTQYELVRLAFKGTALRLTAVGDTKQKIMAWAGALDGIFETFATDFAAVKLNMYRNFRSKPRLLRMQNEIIRVLDPDAVMAEDQLAGEEGEIYAWKYQSSLEEAEHLAQQIYEWVHSEQVPRSEIAVLVSKQLNLYANHLMSALAAKGVAYRNEQQLQDITTEPAARLIVDYLSCLYAQRNPQAWIRLMNLLIPFGDEEIQSAARSSLDVLMRSQRRQVALMDDLGAPYSGWWEYARAFIKEVGVDLLTALSPDYEARARLKEVIGETKLRIEELLKLEPELPVALQRFSDDQAVRILTIHKSKGLEFDSVVILGVESQAFWGKPEEERCAFFVGVSRAKRRLVVTVADSRPLPPSNPYRWQEARTPHPEFIGYAMPFVRQQAR